VNQLQLLALLHAQLANRQHDLRSAKARVEALQYDVAAIQEMISKTVDNGDLTV
jgi:hypothetical protein